jgi:hypothetical protein
VTKIKTIKHFPGHSLTRDQEEVCSIYVIHFRSHRSTCQGFTWFRAWRSLQRGSAGASNSTLKERILLYEYLVWSGHLLCLGSHKTMQPRLKPTRLGVVVVVVVCVCVCVCVCVGGGGGGRIVTRRCHFIDYHPT